jgi:hypothetical protein
MAPISIVPTPSARACATTWATIAVARPLAIRGQGEEVFDDRGIGVCRLFGALTHSRSASAFSSLDSEGCRLRNRPRAEEFDASSPVHLTLDGLQSIDMRFNRAIAPAGDNGRFDGQDIPAQQTDTVLHRSDARRRRAVHPPVEADGGTSLLAGGRGLSQE